MRTPAARSCARTAPAAVPSYISKVSPLGNGLDTTPWAAAPPAAGPAVSWPSAETDGPDPRAIPVTAVAARKSLRDTAATPGFWTGACAPASGAGTFDAGFFVVLIWRPVSGDLDHRAAYRIEDNCSSNLPRGLPAGTKR